MINNCGAIVSECKIDGKLYAQVFKKNFFLVAAIIALSLIGIALEILFCGTDFEAVDIFMLVCLCVLLVLGAFLLAITLWSIKKSNSAQKSCGCEIYQDYLIASLFEKEEKISQIKTDYGSLFKSSETKNYFLAYTGKTSFCPISKDGLTPEELNTVRKLLRLRIRQGTGMAEVANYGGNSCGETAAQIVNVSENGENTDGSVI